MTPHGTPTRYTYHGCRCAKCRAAHAEARREWKAKVGAHPVPIYVQHGSPLTYNNYSCRCDECRAGWAADARRRYQARKAAQ